MSEWRRRAKAAAALAGVTEKSVAQELGKNWKAYTDSLKPGATRLERAQAQGLVEDIAVECGLPRAFATADFRLLEADRAAESFEQVLAALAKQPEDDPRGLLEWLDDLAQHRGSPPSAGAKGEDQSG